MPQELYEQAYRNVNHFSFGRNWQHFLRSLNPVRIENAKKSLSDFLGGTEMIRDKTFIDIGCGSGLFSLAAYLLGAERVVSVDVDDFSLACVKHLWQKENVPKHWKIIKGSALDEEFLSTLGTFDIVYSWGVLHHTGNMCQAIENIFVLTHPNSRIYMALYNENKKFFEGTSAFWLNVKTMYNHSPWIGKKIMEAFYTLYYIVGLMLNGKNPIEYIRNYQSLRGMNFFTDIKDWLGGYPYEFAPSEKIVSFMERLGFVCIKINPARSIGCNEFLFMKKV